MDRKISMLERKCLYTYVFFVIKAGGHMIEFSKDIDLEAKAVRHNEHSIQVDMMQKAAVSEVKSVADDKHIQDKYSKSMQLGDFHSDKEVHSELTK